MVGLGQPTFGDGRTAMTVRDVVGARSSVFSIQPDMTVHDAARYLRDREIRSVAVVDQTARLVGVVSQSDISDKVAAENRCPAWMRVSEIMSTRLVTVTPDEALPDCLHLMERNGIFHLLVVDDRFGYCGMVSVRDLLSVIALDEKSRADMLEALVLDGRSA
jgi:CBS domain-containing protein